MKKITKVATASVLLFTLANPLAVFAENRGGNVSETSSNKTTQDLTITSEEINGDIVFHVTAVRDTYEAIVYATINGNNYTYNLGNLKKGQVSKIVQPDASINNNSASISKESKKEKSLPNTSVVRELVQKTVFHNNEINGNVVEAKVVYKVYEMVEKNSTQNKGREYFPESNVKEGAIVKPEVLVKPEYKEVLGGAIVEPAVQPELPKAEEPSAPAPKAEEPAAPAVPKVEEPAAPAPKAEEPASPTPKTEEPSVPAPKAGKPAAPAPKVEEPAAPAPKAEEPAAPAPKAEEPATPAPKAEEPAASAPKAEEPAAPAPKAEEPTAPAPKAEEPATPAPKVEESAAPAPKAEEPAAPTPKVKEPSAPAPKVEEPAAPTPKVEEPVAPASKAEEATTPAPKVEEPAAPAPKAEEPATPAPKVEEPAKPAPKAEEPTTPAPKAEEPSAPAPKAEEPATPAPKAEEPAAPAPKAEEPAAPAPKAEEPATPAPKAEEPTTPAPKAEEPVTTTPKKDTPSEEVAPKDEKLEEAKKDGKDVIEKIAASKLSEIEKVKDEAEKAKLEAKLKELKEAGLEAINNAKNHDAAVDATDEYQTKIDEINVPGEELPAPNYNKDNLSNGRNEGTTIDNGSTAIGHGSGEATPTPTQPTTERSTTSTAPTQPASTSEGNSGFRNAPEVQVRTKKVVKRDLSNKTKKINIYYNLTALKDIAGALGEVEGENMLTFPGDTSKEDLKRAIEEKTKAQIEKLKKQGFKVVSTTDLDQIVEGGDSYDYVVEFTKESKSTSANNTGFRKAPLVQKRAKRSAEQKETVDVNVYFNLKTLPGIAGALDVDGDTTIKLPKDATVEQVKAAIQTKIAKVEKRGYNVIDAYFGAKTEHGYDFVVEFKK